MYHRRGSEPARDPGGREGRQQHMHNRHTPDAVRISELRERGLDIPVQQGEEQDITEDYRIQQQERQDPDPSAGRENPPPSYVSEYAAPRQDDYTPARARPNAFGIQCQRVESEERFQPPGARPDILYYSVPQPGSSLIP